MTTSEIKPLLINGLKFTRKCMNNDFIYLKGNTVYLNSTNKPYNPGVIGCKYFQYGPIIDWELIK